MGGNGRRVYAALQFRLNRPGPRSSSSACRNGHHVDMTDDEQRDGGVLAGLPASRPQRRSRRRVDEVAPSPEAASAPEGSASSAPAASRAKATSSAKASASAKRPPSGAKGTAKRTAPPNGGRIAQPGQPAGTPPQPFRAGPPPPPDHVAGGVVETAVQAAGELAHIGLTAGGQFVRGVLSRLPRP